MKFQNKVLLWNPEFVVHLARKMIEYLENYYEDSNEFIDDDYEVNLQEDLAWDGSLEMLLEDEELYGFNGTEDFHELSHLVGEQFDKLYPSYFSTKDRELRGVAEDLKSYNRNPLGHYGMSSKDFLS